MTAAPAGNRETYEAGTFGNSHAEAVDNAPRWVLVAERRIATELVREVQCHRTRRSDCRICQLLNEWDRLNPSEGAVL